MSQRAQFSPVLRAPDIKPDTPPRTGWTGGGVEDTSLNVQKRLVGKVWRIPIEGLKSVGNQDTARDASDFLTKAKTKEEADERAIVLIPATLDPKQPIEVLLHLHGHGLGYREFRIKDQAVVRDEAIDKTEQQLQAIHASGRNMIAILPQGTGISGFGDFNADAYLAEAFKILSDRGDLPKSAAPGPVSFSGHSGGGVVIGKMLDEANKQAKKATAGTSRLPGGMRELVLFDGLHGNHHKVLIEFLLRQLDHDLAELTNAERSHWPKAHAEYLTTSFRFRGYHTGGEGNVQIGKPLSGYARRYRAVRKALDEWFARKETVLGGPGEIAFDGLRANYQVIDTGRPGTGAGHEKMMGEGGLFADALKQGGPPATVQPLGLAVVGAQPVTPAIARQIPAEAIPASELGAFGGPEATRFRRRVYQRQLENYAADPDKEFTTGPAKDKLEEVEDGHEMHVVAAADCATLLAHARHDLDEQKMFAEHKPKKDRTAMDKLALKAGGIGIASAYRSMSSDFSAWQNAFSTKFAETQAERAALPDGEFGDAAVRIMVRAMSVKAIPGYSNHTKGLAVDFKTTQGSVALGPRSAQREDWRRSWFYKWLVVHAQHYGFTQLPSEEWHWDHTPPADAP